MSRKRMSKEKQTFIIIVAIIILLTVHGYLITQAMH